jgi:hypothetical protein
MKESLASVQKRGFFNFPFDIPNGIVLALGNRSPSVRCRTDQGLGDD